MTAVLRSFRKSRSPEPRLVGFLPEHLRRQKSILSLTIILYTTIMSTVTSDTPIAKIPQTSGMRKNGQSFLASRYRASAILFSSCAISSASMIKSYKLWLNLF